MKTKNFLGLTAILAVLLSPACDFFSHDEKPPAPVCELDQPFTLWYEQTAECDDWNVTFSGNIQDSRCPTSVVCVWEGRVDVQLEVGDEVIFLGLPQHQDLGQSKDTIDNKVIELLEVLPYPEGTNPIPNDQYQVKLVVTDL